LVYHAYNANISPRKFYFLERNRQSLVTKHYGWMALFLCSPGLVASEILAWGYALTHGIEYTRSKASAVIWACGHLALNRRKHRRMIRTRKISDRQLIVLLDESIPLNGLGAGIVLSGGSRLVAGLANRVIQANKKALFGRVD
jgi:hypothetical protein